MRSISIDMWLRPRPGFPPFGRACERSHNMVRLFARAVNLTALITTLLFVLVPPQSRAQGSSNCGNVLSDANNCGICGVVCGPGLTCSDGVCSGTSRTSNLSAFVNAGASNGASSASNVVSNAASSAGNAASNAVRSAGNAAGTAASTAVNNAASTAASTAVNNAVNNAGNAASNSASTAQVKRKYRRNSDLQRASDIVRRALRKHTVRTEELRCLRCCMRSRANMREGRLRRSRRRECKCHGK